MKKIYNPAPSDWSDLLQRPTQTVADIEGTVEEVFKAVQNKGDVAIREYTQRFDKVDLESIIVTNIYRFHEAQKTKRVSVETSPGVHCWQEKRPIEKVGLYIPGGTAPLFSTILMLIKFLVQETNL